MISSRIGTQAWLRGPNTLQPAIHSTFDEDHQVTLHHGDCMDLLHTVPDDSIQRIVTSPPYNLGKAYEKRMDMEAYYAWQQQVIRECHRVLKPTGSLCWQVGNYVANGEVVPLDLLLYPIFTTLRMKMRNRIVWHFGHGLHANKRFLGRHETVMWWGPKVMIITLS